MEENYDWFRLIYRIGTAIWFVVMAVAVIKACIKTYRERKHE